MIYEYPGRDLFMGRSGDDVHVLHDVLIFLGYTIPIKEYSKKIFGQETKDSIIKIQQKFGVPLPTGSVVKDTVKYINKALEEKKPSAEFVIFGVVKYRNGPVAQGLTIKAYDVNQSIEKKLGSDDIIGDIGRYQIEYGSDELIEPEHKSPNLLVRAFRGKKEVARSEIRKNARDMETIDLIVPEDSPEPETLIFTVSGHVYNKEGSPAEGLIVRALDFDSEVSTKLGEDDQTDDNGYYQIDYPTDQLLDPEAKSPNLRVQAIKDGKVVASMERRKAKPNETIDLILESPPQPCETHIVSGRVTYSDGRPFTWGQVRAFHEGGAVAIRLGEDSTDGDGLYTIRYQKLPGLSSIDLRVSLFDGDGNLLKSSDIIHDARPVEIVSLITAIADKPPASHRIEGRIVLENGLPADDLTLRLYRRDFGEAETKIAEAVTGEFGQYILSFHKSGKSDSLEVRAVIDGEEISLTDPLHDLSEGEKTVLNLVAPESAKPLAAEYQRLTADIIPYVGEMKKLADAREDDERQDLTVLNRATGWDARLLAMASKAEKLSAEMTAISKNEKSIANQASSIPQEALFGLFRTGLPSDKLQLARVSPDVVGQALTKAREVGIVNLNEEQIRDVKSQFESFSLKTRLAIPAPGSRSTYGSFLQASGLEQEKQAKFASVYLDHRGDAAQLWEKAAFAGIAHDEIQILQLEGKLAFLTGNSVAVTTRLSGDMKISDPAQLVENDLFRAERWMDQINAAANIPPERWSALTDDDKNRLEELIPAAYVGKSIEERREVYAEDMARKVRLSYPTQVISHMVENDVCDEFKLGAARSGTTMLLKNAAAKGFKLGQTPVESFLNAYPEVLSGIGVSDAEAAKQSVKTLQRVYQITPSNESMSILMSLGFTSAYDVVAIPMAVFLDRYGHLFPSIEHARMIYRKAEQVSAVTYNLFTIAKKLDSEPPVPVISAPVEVREEVKKELIKRFPTMESLFGSLDFCECEHCRSVLSPAAYLVDLLQFLDVEETVWKNFLDDWKKKHGNKDYGANYRKPYDEIIKRRPDIPYLQLTCENTNTALPYIDVVNEILEYYVANHKLEAKAAHDTGSATSPELLAEPQNIVSEAYTKLQEARYPLTLPFDLWLETTRSFCDYFEVPLWRLLEALRSGDELFMPRQAYDRSAIFIESLGLSPSEYAIFTDPKPLDKWYELYGYDDAEEATDKSEDPDTGQRIDLNSAKALSRRLGVTYKELVEIIRTGFVNPRLASLEVLNKLGVAINDVRYYQTHKGFYESNRDLLGKDRDTLSNADRQRFDRLTAEDWKRLAELEAFDERLDDLSEKFKAVGFDAKSWLSNQLETNSFDEILVLADPDAGCNFDETTIQYAGGQAADDIAFLKINLFVRLWRKLGWTIEELDRALQAFMPKNAPLDKEHLDKSPLKTALIYLAHLKSLDVQLRIGKNSRSKLLTLWSPMATAGDNSLYSQIFLKRSILKSDAVFDDPLGNYLSPTSLAAMAQSRKHQVSLQGVLPADKIDPAAFSGIPKISLHYDAQIQVQYLTYEGVLTDDEKAQLAALSPSPLLKRLLEYVQELAKEFSLIKGHLLALQGALGLTADEISNILKDVGNSIDAAKLSLENVSLLYRYELLAKALKLSITELIALKQLSGLDPFHPLSEEPLTKLDWDYPFVQSLRYIEVVDQVKDSGLKIEDLEYLLRHRFDQEGKYRPKTEANLALLKALSDGIRAILAEYAVPSDLKTLGEDVLRQKLGLALPPEVMERLLAMINGTAEFTASRPNVSPSERLVQETLAEEPSIRQVGYNEARQEQKLTFRGVLFEAQKNSLKSKLPKPTAPNPFVPSQVLSDLLDDVQAQALSFFDNYLKKQPLKSADEAGFLDASDFEKLFSPLEQPALGDTLEEIEKKKKRNEEALQSRRALLARTFLPFLQRRLIRQLIVQTWTAQTGMEASLVEALLTDAKLLGESQPLLEAFATTAERGINARFFDASGAQLKAMVFSDADTALKDELGDPLQPAGSSSVLFEGYLEAPSPGAYRFYIQLGMKDAQAELRFDHLPEPFLKGVAASDGAQIDNYTELKPGILYRFTLEIRNLGGGEARLLVQGETLPKQSLAQLAIFPRTTIDSAGRSLVLLSKVAQLITSLALTEREIRYLLTHADDFDQLNLSRLPASESDSTPEGAKALFGQFLRLSGYVRLKRDLAGGTEDIISVFEAKDLENAYSLIARLTRRDEATVKATTRAVFTVPSFSDELALQRLWEALWVVERFGVSVTSISRWTSIVSPSATSDQRFAIARDLRETIKSRFEPEAWHGIAQPIFDKLRQRQRDALVAYVMHQDGFARKEQLYEHFLIDPGMEPVVQTSRIRLAISSVQLFIQRCLLNLEKDVHPSAIINAKQWEWMKRYRIWEANRKIFLFPENWLEPEFRDDKTHLFVELESSLLQGDVSNDLVEDAFLNYLKKLEELARLDIVAMHCEYNADPAQNVLHVIGRTYSEPHKYFYRRYLHEMWVPWEPVTAEIEGDHLAPVIWRDRLYLFWVTFLEKADQPTTSSSSQSMSNVTEGNVIGVAHIGWEKNEKITELTLSQLQRGIMSAVATKKVEVQLHWSEYLHGQWSTRESGGFRADHSVKISSDFDSKSVFIHVSKKYDEDGNEQGVFIHMGGQINQAFYLAGRNSTPKWVSRGSAPNIPYSQSGVSANRYSGNGPLTVGFVQEIAEEVGTWAACMFETKKILEKGGEYTLLPCDNAITLGSPEIASLVTPIFYQDDSQTTFFVEPNLEERTVEEWKEWVTRMPEPEVDWIQPDWWDRLYVKPQYPKIREPILTDPVDPIWRTPTDPRSTYKVISEPDWLVNSVTVMQFREELIGPAGRAGLKMMPSVEAAGVLASGGISVNVHAGSELGQASSVVAKTSSALAAAGLIHAAEGLKVVGSSGLNSALAKNIVMVRR